MNNNFHAVIDYPRNLISTVKYEDDKVFYIKNVSLFFIQSEPRDIRLILNPSYELCKYIFEEYTYLFEDIKDPPKDLLRRYNKIIEVFNGDKR